GDTSTPPLIFLNFQNMTFSGNKFYDLNTNGVKDGSGEVAIRGWTINLYRENGLASGLQTSGINMDTLVASTTTDSSGNYSFTNGGNGYGPGTYYVVEAPAPTPSINTNVTAGGTWYETTAGNTGSAGYLGSNGGPGYYTDVASSGFATAQNF